MLTSINSLSKTLVDGLNRFAGWILLLAIGWLCWGIAQIIWLFMAAPQAPQLPLEAIQTRQTPSVNTSTALSVFQSSQPKPVQSNQPPANVELIGVMLASPDALSSAILSVNGVTANYRVGEVLQPTGYKLLDVDWNQAILETNNGQQVVLDMPERMQLDQELNINGSTASGNIRNRRLPTNNNRRDAVSAAINARAAGTTPAASQPANINNKTNANTEANNIEAEVDKAVEQLKQNPASYLSSMGVMATGSGYEVTGSMPVKVRNKLGLESGDRVLSVNGQNVGSNPAGDADLLMQVKRSGEATIEVKRGEQIITIRQQF